MKCSSLSNKFSSVVNEKQDPSHPPNRESLVGTTILTDSMNTLNSHPPIPQTKNNIKD